MHKVDVPLADECMAGPIEKEENGLEECLCGYQKFLDWGV